MTPKNNAAQNSAAISLTLKPAAGVLMQLDPNTIVLSELASRTPANKTEKTYNELRESIQATGGNVTPGLVLRQSPTAGSDETVDVLVNGYRSWEICKDLGTSFNAIVVDEMSFVEMARYMALSNSGRKSLSALEAGRFYRACLQKKLFVSQAEMARALGVSASDVSNALAIASLPPLVIGAFGSEDDLQYRYAKPLKDAIKADEKKVLAIAKRLAKRQAGLVNKIDSAEVMLQLTGWNTGPGATKPAETPAPIAPTTGSAASAASDDSATPSLVDPMPPLVDAEVPMVPLKEDVDADAIPTSSSRPLLRDDAQAKASVTLRPSTAWPIPLDGLPCGTVNLLATGAFQIDLEIGLGLTARHGAALAQHISDFLGDHAFSADAGDEY